jgi:hypothetical protein
MVLVAGCFNENAFDETVTSSSSCIVSSAVARHSHHEPRIAIPISLKKNKEGAASLLKRCVYN